MGLPADQGIRGSTRHTDESTDVARTVAKGAGPRLGLHMITLVRVPRVYPLGCRSPPAACAWPPTRPTSSCTSWPCRPGAASPTPPRYSRSSITTARSAPANRSYQPAAWTSGVGHVQHGVIDRHHAGPGGLLDSLYRLRILRHPPRRVDPPRQPAGRTTARPRGSGRASGAVAVSLAEHLHLGVGLVDVDGEVIELLDELLDVLRLELGEVDRYP